MNRHIGKALFVCIALLFVALGAPARATTLADQIASDTHSTLQKRCQAAGVTYSASDIWKTNYNIYMVTSPVCGGLGINLHNLMAQTINSGMYFVFVGIFLGLEAWRLVLQGERGGGPAAMLSVDYWLPKLLIVLVGGTLSGQAIMYATAMTVKDSVAYMISFCIGTDAYKSANSNAGQFGADAVALSTGLQNAVFDAYHATGMCLTGPAAPGTVQVYNQIAKAVNTNLQGETGYRQFPVYRVTRVTTNSDGSMSGSDYPTFDCAQVVTTSTDAKGAVVNKVVKTPSYIDVSNLTFTDEDGQINYIDAYGPSDTILNNIKNLFSGAHYNFLPNLYVNDPAWDQMFNDSLPTLMIFLVGRGATPPSGGAAPDNIMDGSKAYNLPKLIANIPALKEYKAKVLERPSTSTDALLDQDEKDALMDKITNQAKSIVYEFLKFSFVLQMERHASLDVHNNFIDYSTKHLDPSLPIDAHKAPSKWIYKTLTGIMTLTNDYVRPFIMKFFFWFCDAFIEIYIFLFGFLGPLCFWEKTSKPVTANLNRVGAVILYPPIFALLLIFAEFAFCGVARMISPTSTLGCVAMITFAPMIGLIVGLANLAALIAIAWKTPAMVKALLSGGDLLKQGLQMAAAPAAATAAIGVGVATGGASAAAMAAMATANQSGAGGAPVTPPTPGVPSSAPAGGSPNPTGPAPSSGGQGSSGASEAGPNGASEVVSSGTHDTEVEGGGKIRSMISGKMHSVAAKPGGSGGLRLKGAKLAGEADDAAGSNSESDSSGAGVAATGAGVSAAGGSPSGAPGAVATGADSIAPTATSTPSTEDNSSSAGSTADASESTFGSPQAPQGSPSNAPSETPQSGAPGSTGDAPPPIPPLSQRSAPSNEAPPSRLRALGHKFKHRAAKPTLHFAKVAVKEAGVGAFAAVVFRGDARKMIEFHAKRSAGVSHIKSMVEHGTLAKKHKGQDDIESKDLRSENEVEEEQSVSG